MKKTIKIALLICLISLVSIFAFTACNISYLFPETTESTLENNEQTTPLIDEHTHIFSEWIIIKEAKCEETGLTQRYCTECAYTESQPITSLGHSFGAWAMVKETTPISASREK